MSRRRRAALLLGLALLLGTLAATTVARRESALDAQLGPPTAVVVARADLVRGHRLQTRDLALRRLPARYAPVGAARDASELLARALAVPVRRGGVLSAELLDVGDQAIPRPPVRRGERAADVVAQGSPSLVVPGARVDVLVTGESGGTTELALEDVEVLAAGRAPPSSDARGNRGPRVEATLRVTVPQAIYLTAAQAFAREVRLLARAAGDRTRHGHLRVDAQDVR